MSPGVCVKPGPGVFWRVRHDKHEEIQHRNRFCKNTDKYTEVVMTDEGQRLTGSYRFDDAALSPDTYCT